MKTGSAALGSASEARAEANGVALRPNMPRDGAAGIAICLVTDAPEDAYAHAVAAGAAPVEPVETKPWGQTVSCVRDLNGCRVEVCSPVPGR